VKKLRVCRLGIKNSNRDILGAVCSELVVDFTLDISVSILNLGSASGEATLVNSEALLFDWTYQDSNAF
jgi:hypothetical protein